MVGYALLSVVIALATVLLVYVSRGFYVDSEGTVIQNGLMYIDTEPVSADVYLNGEKQSGKTDARLVVPEGNYSIELKRAGYWPWQRSVRLDGGSLRRLTYVRLVPESLSQKQYLNLPAAPDVVSQSDDGRWLLLMYNKTPGEAHVVDLRSGTPRLVDVPFPAEIATQLQDGVWGSVQWADDNKTFLAAYSSGSTTTHVLADRTDPEQTVTLRDSIPLVSFTSATLHDGKRDRVYLHDADESVLYTANVTSGESAVLIEGVIEFAATGRDTVLYVTDALSSDGTVEVRLRERDDERSVIRTGLQESDTYLLDVGSRDDSPVVAISSPAEDRVIVYDDPRAAISSSSISDIPVPTTVMRIADPQQLMLSDDASAVIARGGDSFTSHEFTEDRTYAYSLNVLGQDIASIESFDWVDNRYMTLRTDTSHYFADFTGDNTHAVVDTVGALPLVFDDRRERIISVETRDSGAARLVETSLLAPDQ